MFKEVNSKANFAQMEEEILKFWKENNIFEKSIENREGSKEYITYDGPPFATGLPHYGHIVPGTIKDIFPRYQTMKGRLVKRRFGWDCHGLPVEYEIEKDLKVKGRADIEKYGVKNFNAQCRSIVQRYTSEWRATVERLGRWTDMDNAYKTMDLEYMESIWWVFKTLYEKGFIYEGYNILPYSPALASPLSNFEVNLGGYQDVIDQAITVKFKLKDEENTYFLAWTTTPWTLVSNLALALGSDIDYVKIKDNDEYYILAESRLSSYYKNADEYEIIKRYKGIDLAEIKYEPIFNYFKEYEDRGAFITVLGDYVTTEDGTGIVHTAPGFGEDDYKVLKDRNIGVVCPVDLECNFTSEIKELEGRFVKDCDKDIINMLKEKEVLVKRENYLHSYPFCYRTKKPLIYRALRCWFVDVPAIKERMLRANSQIKWSPPHIKEGRFGKWLEGAREWAISRNRYWGNPIPVWKSESGDYIQVIGSKQELEEKSGVKVTDLHKEFVDEITWKAPDGSLMKRVPDILDCWFESGSMPYAQKHYPFENKEEFEATYPADFICEGIDQTRGWFYTLTVIAAGLFDKPAFLNCVTNGIILAEDGKKMSKSLKNYKPPEEIVNLYGADAMRFMLMNSNSVKADDVKFSEESIKEVVKNFILPIYNAYSFFITYANIDNYEPKMVDYKNLTNDLDKWIFSVTQSLIKEVTLALDDYDIYRSTQALLGFIDNLNNWYIRRSRRRFWKSETDADKISGYDVLYYILLNFSKISAPIVPFITEVMYQNLRTKDMPESVHICDWPSFYTQAIDKELEGSIALVQKTSSLGRALRANLNYKIRQPLAKCFVVSREDEERRIINEYSDTICEELNVKALVVDHKEDKIVTYSAKANFKILGKIFQQDMKQAAALIEKLSSDEINNILNDGTYTISVNDLSYDLKKEDIVVTRSEKEGVHIINDGSITVGFDVRISEDLRLEGLSRDLVRHIQILRRDTNLNVSDHIILRVLTTDESLNKAIKQFYTYIKNETLSDQIYIVHLDGDIALSDANIGLEVCKA